MLDFLLHSSADFPVLHRAPPPVLRPEAETLVAWKEVGLVAGERQV